MKLNGLSRYILAVLASIRLALGRCARLARPSGSSELDSTLIDDASSKPAGCIGSVSGLLAGPGRAGPVRLETCERTAAVSSRWAGSVSLNRQNRQSTTVADLARFSRWSPRLLAAHHCTLAVNRSAAGLLLPI